jgi:hypothetical protein
MNCSKCGLPITFAEADQRTTALQHAICPQPMTTPTPETDAAESISGMEGIVSTDFAHKQEKGK